MSDLQFDEQNNFQFKSREVFGDYKKPGIANWLQEKGIVKDEITAKYILIAIIIICLSLTGFLLFRNFGSDAGEQLSPREIEQLPAELRILYE